MEDKETKDLDKQLAEASAKSVDRIAKMIGAGVTPEEIKEIGQMGTDADFKVGKAFADFKEKQKLALNKIDPYIRAHRYYLVVPMTLMFIVGGLVFWGIDPRHIFTLIRTDLSKKILLAMLYSAYVYIVFSLLCYANLVKFDSFLDLISLRVFEEERYTSALLSAVLWEYFTTCDPKDGYTVANFKKLLKNKYGFRVTYDDCLEFLEDDQIKQSGNPEIEQILYGIRLKIEPKK